jgi:hypothetical protein
MKEIWLCGGNVGPTRGNSGCRHKYEVPMKDNQPEENLTCPKCGHKDRYDASMVILV